MRLRPILMTSIATVMGAVPLVVFGGPGSASRATIGIVVIFGVAFSTLLSLFVVPVFYAALARYTRSPEELAHRLDALEAETRRWAAMRDRESPWKPRAPAPVPDRAFRPAPMRRRSWTMPRRRIRGATRNCACTG